MYKCVALPLEIVWSLWIVQLLLFYLWKIWSYPDRWMNWDSRFLSAQTRRQVHIASSFLCECWYKGQSYLINMQCYSWNNNNNVHYIIVDIIISIIFNGKLWKFSCLLSSLVINNHIFVLVAHVCMNNAILRWIVHGWVISQSLHTLMGQSQLFCWWIFREKDKKDSCNGLFYSLSSIHSRSLTLSHSLSASPLLNRSTVAWQWLSNQWDC